MWYLPSVLGVLAIIIIIAPRITEGVYQCKHEIPSGHQLRYATVVDSDGETRRGKRQAGSEFEPMRIMPYYDSTIENLSPEVKKQIQNDTVAHVIDFFSRALRVRPVQGRLLFQRDCINGTAIHGNPAGFCPRSRGCGESSCSKIVTLPPELLSACKVCDDDGTNCETIGQDGTGVESTDFLLYVSANTTHPKCSPNSLTLAFAVACQLERQYDRPIFGFANICVNRALKDGVENLRSILIHEISHALVFSEVLFPFYRDENSNPRTARDPNTGLPKKKGSGTTYIPDSTTLDTTQVSRTTIPNGTFSYTVSQIVTPAVVREVRAHFGCDSLTGAFLEDLARVGTGGNHFEQRVFNNEIMTGTIDESNAIVSRITLGLYEDSGWYKPNYEVAQPLRWGENMGCDFVLSGCLTETKMLRPSYCSDIKELAGYREARSQGKVSIFREAGFNSSCAWDRGSYGACLLQRNAQPFDPNYQYFTDPRLGGLDPAGDNCPIIHSFISCKQPRNTALTINAFAEVHGSQSKCVEFRIDKKWVYDNNTIPPIIGGACYEVYCMEGEGPVVTVNGANYSCADQKEVYIPQVDLPDFASVMTIVCPPCEDLCWDNVKACPSSTTAFQPAATFSGYEGAKIAGAVLFTLVAVILIAAIAAAVVAGILFWKWNRDKPTKAYEPSVFENEKA